MEDQTEICARYFIKIITCISYLTQGICQHFWYVHAPPPHQQLNRLLSQTEIGNLNRLNQIHNNGEVSFDRILENHLIASWIS